MEQQEKQIEHLKADIDQPITMDQIVDWTKQGLTSHEIINRIKQSRSTYTLTADDIHWFASHGVSEDVIKAMQSTQ